MNKLPVSAFNIEQTLLGGQSFSWDYKEGAYYGATSGRVIKILPQGNSIYWQTYPLRDDFAFIERYFRLHDDYEAIIRSISEDKNVAQAVARYPGLRLLKQDFADTVISFIISQNSNIPKIKRSITLLREKYGDIVDADGINISLFPTLERLSQLSLDELNTLGLGYRSSYMYSSVKSILQSNLAVKIHSLDYENARLELLKLHGVGEKVAGCILVFSLGFDHITPLDVWAKRVLTDLYHLDPAMKYEEMLLWMQSKFDASTSWAGQFLFEYMRNMSN